MGLGVLVSRPSAPFSGRPSNGPPVVAAPGEGLVVRLSTQVGSGGSFSLSWAPETLSYRKKFTFLFQVISSQKVSLLWGTFKEKFSIASPQLSNIISVKAQEMMPSSVSCITVYLSYGPSHCPAWVLLCWAFQRDPHAGHEKC